MPPHEAVCRTCLAVDVPLIAIAGTPLQLVFEKLTSTQLLCSKQRPESACYLCHAHLRRCRKFMLQAARAEAILTDILRTSQVTKQTVSVVDRVAAGLCPPLAVSGAEIVDSTVAVLVEIKIEQEADNVDIDIEEGSLRPPNTLCGDVPSPGCETGDIGLSHHAPVKWELMEDTRSLANKATNVSSQDVLPTSSPHKPPPFVHIKMENIEEEEERQSSMSSSQLDAEPGARTQEDWSHASCDRDAEKHTLRTGAPGAGQGEYVCVDTGKKIFQCNICHRQFSRRFQLRCHFRIHTGEKPYKCNICERGFAQASNLKIHSRVHSGEKPHQCNVCHRQFSERTDLRNHERIHTGEKPFKCNICQKSFARRCTLKIHVRIHGGGEFFECNDCQRRFTNKSDLRRHLKTHSVNNLECNACHRHFKKLFNFNRHLNAHKKCKLFECNICQKKFTRVGNMRKHSVNMHPGVTQPP